MTAARPLLPDTGQVCPDCFPVLQCNCDEPCRVYSHGADGWHCALTGPHEEHANWDRTVTW